MTRNPIKVSSLVQRTVCSVNFKCSTLPECSRCVAFQFHCVTGALIRQGLVPKFWFLCSLFSYLLRSLLPVVSTPLFETPFLADIPPPLWKRTINVFVYFLSHFQFSFAKSNVIVLSFLDLKVSQVSFSVIGESLVALDSRLPCYYCIWFEFVVFLVRKASIHFQIVKCCDCLHFLFWKETC